MKIQELQKQVAMDKEEAQKLQVFILFDELVLSYENILLSYKEI